jgi:hypothetical protein
MAEIQRWEAKMALSAGSMKNDIINALKSGADTAEKANKKFGDAILKNICDNITITYSWAAVSPPPASSPDPVVTFTASISGGGTLTPSNSYQLMLIKLATLIKGLTITAPAGFAVAPLAFNPAGALTVVMANEDNQNDAMEHFCVQVITSIISGFPNPVPAAGAHGAFTGATTGMMIL